MQYRFNRIIETLPASASIALMDKGRELKAAGADVISLAGGEPDFDTPPLAALAGIHGITSGHTHYGPGRGLLRLREQLAHKLWQDNLISVTPDQILVTPGGKFGVFLAVYSLINPGDEVIIFTPAWVSYGPIVQLAGGVPVYANLHFETQYRIDQEVLEACVSPRSRILIVNSPNNPTGRVLTSEECDVIVEFALKHDLMIISDEIYEKIIFDDHKHVSLGSIEAIRDRVITINGFSKASAMTGWRLGYTCASQTVIDTIYKLYQHTMTCVSEFSQDAAMAALEDIASVELMRQSYLDRRNQFIHELQKNPHITCLMPEGAFYAWVKVDYQGMSAQELSFYLLDRAGVITVPGHAYGCEEPCLRMCFAAPMEELVEAAKRINSALSDDLL